MKHGVTLARLAPAGRLPLALLLWMVASQSHAAQTLPPSHSSANAAVRYVVPGGSCQGSEPC